MAATGEPAASSSLGQLFNVSDAPALAVYNKRCIVLTVQTLLTSADVLARFGHALSDPTRVRLLLALRGSPGYPSELTALVGGSRQGVSNHLTCLRGCGLVVAVPEGRRVRYELADARLGHALGDLLGVVLAVDSDCSPVDICDQEQ